jgi:Flp pilus assembly protein TadG
MLRIRHIIKDNRGATAAFVALGMVMMLGTVALAVDLGMMLGARTGSQRVADAAALAGAGSLITAPDDEARARQWALDYAAKNGVLGTIADVRPEDVEVLLDEHKVRVRVYNVDSRSNAIKTIFGQVLGWKSMDVATVAAAEAVSAGSGVCPLPIALPDRWLDNPGGPNPADGRFNLADGDKYEPYSDPPENVKPMEGQCLSPPGYGRCSVPPGVGPSGYAGDAYTGFYGDDLNANLGDVIEIKTQSGPPNKGGGDTDPLIGDGSVEQYNASPCVDASSWRCWYLPDGSSGASNLVDWVLGCPDKDDPVVIEVGEDIEPETGNVQSVVIQAFKDLVDDYGGDNWSWNPSVGMECMENAGTCMEEADPEAFLKRHRPLPVIDPTSATTNQDDATVIRWECVFVEKVAETYYKKNGQPTRNGDGAPGQWNVYVRFARCGDGMAPGPDTGQTLKTLRLVE